MKFVSGSFLGLPNLVWIAGGAGVYLWYRHSHASGTAPGDLSTTPASPMPRRRYKSRKRHP